jgi:formylglycine-generating enzyme required for sulfatase activity
MPLTAGQTLNIRYRIIRLLSQGGFGAVYQAWDSNLGRQVAIKENLHTGEQSQRQFIQEAQLLAGLSHPNLPRVTDYFLIPGVGQYLVMDFIEGQDLKELLARQAGALPEAQVLAWIDQVCQALDYLHRQNPPIIHRDIKPANIRITPLGQVMLVDFGIAKLFDAGRGTTAGARAVTPGYSPIEQYGIGKTDPRSDLYALGATLYTLLSGQEPVESVQRVTGDTLIPAQRLNPALSANSLQVLDRALQMNPAMRYQSAAELRAGLHGSLPAAQAGGLPRRWPGLAAAIAGGLGILCFVLVFGMALRWQPWKAPATEPGQALAASPAAAASATPITAAALPIATPSRTPAPALSLQPGALYHAPSDGATLVYIPAGQFWMGAEEYEAGPRFDQLPKHAVTLAGYWIDQTEVTNRQYEMCVSAGACLPPAKDHSSTRKLYFGNPDYKDYPVVWVSWNDAAQYCQWAGRRLPSEAEWERAARGDSGKLLFPWGSSAPDGSQANLCDANCTLAGQNAAIDDGYSDTSPAGFFPTGASPFGVLEMAGNVWEWVQDYYDARYYAASPAANPPGPLQGDQRVLRGGSFENQAQDLHAANRFFFDPQAATSSFGFRCAASLEQIAP